MKLYQLKDFYCSAFLIANGYELADHRRSQGFTLFFFEETDELKRLVNKYYSLATTVEPVQYSNALRALKGIIHSLSTSTSDQGLNNNVEQYRREK